MDSTSNLFFRLFKLFLKEHWEFSSDQSSNLLHGIANFVDDRGIITCCSATSALCSDVCSFPSSSLICNKNQRLFTLVIPSHPYSIAFLLKAVTHIDKATAAAQAHRDLTSQSSTSLILANGQSATASSGCISM